MRTKNTINYKKKTFIVGVVGFEPTAFLMCGFYRPVPIRHLSSTPIFTEREVNFPYISPVFCRSKNYGWLFPHL